MKARGRVQIGSGGFQLHLDRATVGDTEGHGVLVKGKAGSVGAFLIEHGLLHAGLELRGGDVKLKPLASFDWLEERQRVIAGGGPPCKTAASRLAP